MKDNNLPNDYNSLSLEELTIKANEIIEELEKQKDLEKSIDNNRIVIRCPGVHEDGKRCSHIFTRDDIAPFVTEEHLNRWLEARTVNYQQRLDDILASDTPEREFVQTLCKPCPRCRVIVFKDEGCDDMTCTCGTNFCYLCGETICTCSVPDATDELLHTV